MSTLTLRFGRFELQPAERRLLAEGRELPLGGRAFDLLVLLATQPGRLVTKAELLDRVWAGLVVEEANLTVQVSNLRKVLGDDVIATIPGRGYRFVAPVDAANDERMAAAGPVTTDAGTDARDDAPPAVARVAPPPLLVGRDDDLARVEAALAAPGCHTLTGPAGVGKTSLAQAVAARWAAHVVWVDLVTVTGPGQVMPALARALGQAAPEDGQPEMLAGRLAAGTLLVLDNAEHVADGVLALLQALRPQAAGLHALVTSQVPVAWQGERVLPLGPLPLPPAGLPDAQALTHGAVGLLAARIAAADPRIAIGTAQRPLLTAVAQALDGLPLALEMAAARVPLLGLQGVHDALEQRFALLRSRQRGVADRHQTLHAALDWSYGLLAPDEQTLFRTLGVFAGGFTLELLHDVAGDADGDRWALVDRLAVLVDRSLVATDDADPPRYRLLETMRHYALERLVAAGDEAGARRRHARAVLKRLDDLERHWMPAAGRKRTALLAASLAEIHNARAALAWGQAHDARLAVEVALRASMMASFTEWRAQTAAWLAALEPLVHRVPGPQQAMYWRELGRQRLIEGTPGAVEACRRARALYAELEDDGGRFWASVTLVRACRAPGPDVDLGLADLTEVMDRHPEWTDHARAAAAGTRAWAQLLRGDHAALLAEREAELELARRSGNDDAASAAEGNIAEALRLLGRHDEAIERTRRVLGANAALADANAAYLRQNLLANLVEAGRLDEALAEAPRALQLCRRVDVPDLMAWLALLAARQQRPRAAAQLAGHAAQAYVRRSATAYAGTAHALERAREAAVQALGDAAARHWEARGQGLDEAAVDALLQSGGDTGH